MKISYSSDLGDGRDLKAIGRVKAAARWRAADQPETEAERQAALEALAREAAEYGADAVVDVRFDVDDVKGVDVEGVALQRVSAAGLAVRFARVA